MIKIETDVNILLNVTLVEFSMVLSPAQCRAARALIAMDQATLAEAANVSRNVIIDFEKGRRTPGRNNLAAIQRALEQAGAEFTNGRAPGVRLKKSKK